MTDHSDSLISFSLIYACDAETSLIGFRDSTGLPWAHIKEDMERFRRLTAGKVMICGRRTYEDDLEYAIKLGDRKLIVITRDEKIAERAPEGVYTAKDPYEAAFLASNIVQVFDMSREIMVIGGSQIYKEYASSATKIYKTSVRPIGNFTYDGEYPVYMPEIRVSLDNMCCVTLKEYKRFIDSRGLFELEFSTFLATKHPLFQIVIVDEDYW